MKYTLKLPERVITYDLTRKNVKNINVRIKADATICVSASEDVKICEIEKFLTDKAKFIVKSLKQYEEIERYSQGEKHFVDGETFKLFGRDVRLKVFKGRENTISSDESYIYLTVKNVDNIKTKSRVVDNWLKQKCEEMVLKICNEVYPKFKKYNVDFPLINFRKMISRWGSCLPQKKSMIFNYKLVEVPVSCIEYVVVHEFTHFLQPDHSKKFYLKLSMFMPDWKERKKQLDYEFIWGV